VCGVCTVCVGLVVGGTLALFVMRVELLLVLVLVLLEV
jgi:hypothetical protein